MDEREQNFWHKLERTQGVEGTPQAVCSAISPFPFWLVVTALIIFIPLALILSFSVKRHAILIQSGEIVVLDLSFWRYLVREERFRAPLGTSEVTLDGSKLEVGGKTLHIEPGWGDSARKLIELNGTGTGTA